VTPARTRADTIRLAAPAIVVLLLLGGYALWTGLLLSTAASAVTPTVAVTATLPPATAVTGAAPTPTIAPTATVTPPPTSPPPTSTPAPPATPPPAGLQAGRAAIVDTGPDNANLRLRREPGSDGVIIRGIRNGERLTLVEGPRRVEAQEWWKIEYSGVTGWVAGAYLKPAE
jgi:hypothetical protein